MVKAWAFSVMSGVADNSLLGQRERISALAVRAATEYLEGVAATAATETRSQQASAVAVLVVGSLMLTDGIPLS